MLSKKISFTFCINSRFQKHLDRVKEIVKNAFAALPDPVDNESNLSDSIKMELDGDSNSSDNNIDGCHPLDRLMCKIADKIQ